MFLSGRKGLLHPMIARDDGRIGQPHVGVDYRFWSSFMLEAIAPLGVPSLKVRILVLVA